MDYKWTALTVTMVGTLMAGIDFRIVVVGLPTVAEQLHAGAEEAVWITQAYSLAITIGLLFVGRLTDLFGRVRLYVFGFAILTVGSTLSAISFDPLQLIAARLVQGVGAGILITNSSAIITDASPRNELGTMLGINQTAFRLGNLAGLTLSGVVLSFFDWRGLFYVNIPIGIFGTLWAHRRLKEISTRDPARKMDWPGAFLFSGGLALLLLAITFLSFGTTIILEGYSLLLVGSAFLVGFTLVEIRTASPLLDLTLFKIKVFAAGNLAQVLNSLAWAGVTLLLSFYLQLGLGYAPLQAGLGLLPLDIAYTIFSLSGGRLSDRYGTRTLSTIGLAVNTVGFLGMAMFSASTPYPTIVAVLVLIGVGSGLFIPPNLRAIMGSVPPMRVGIASAFRNTMFNGASAASYGLVILLITIGMPYADFSHLLETAGGAAAGSRVAAEFFSGLQTTSFVFAVVNGLAIIPAVMGGGKHAPAKAGVQRRGDEPEGAGASGAGTGVEEIPSALRGGGA